MKFKTKSTKVTGQYTREGVTVPVTRTIAATVPAFPRNWNAIALKTAVSTVLGLTLLTIVWSTWSIGSLLGGGLGYAVAGVYDISWGVCLLLEYLSRYDESKAALPKQLGWGLLVVTMLAIGWHGYALGSIPMAVVGALVSLFAKTLWYGVMRHINAELTPEDKTWLSHQISQAQTKAAIAQVRWTAARTEQGAALAMLAMEHEMAEARQAFGLDTAELPAKQAIELEAPTLADMSKSDAIRFVKGKRPELEAAEISQALEDQGVTVKPEYVKQVLSRTAEPEGAEVIELRK